MPRFRRLRQLLFKGQFHRHAPFSVIKHLISGATAERDRSGYGAAACEYTTGGLAWIQAAMPQGSACILLALLGCARVVEDTLGIK
ncbi:hypothetical protein ACD578_13760 [Microvirga sp. RSM25]|uniref:hypothetical protein n=1 Tax=Microvirga sp. RSM25 TaxID=3273802 RepID=UPI00384BC3F5